MNRYSNKRHRGPNDRGFKITEYGKEGNIPVVVAAIIAPKSKYYLKPEYLHIRGFYLHPTKGWRSTGPEGRR